MTPLPPNAFKAFARCIASSVFIVTTNDETGQPQGATITAATSLSLKPPLLLICLAHTSNTCAAIRESGHFRLHILGSHQSDVSQVFASKEPTKDHASIGSRNPRGAPMIDGAIGAADCQVVSMVDAGDHSIIIAAPDAIATEGGDPLVYHQSAYRRLHGPLAAAVE